MTSISDLQARYEKLLATRKTFDQRMVDLVLECEELREAIEIAEREQKLQASYDEAKKQGFPISTKPGSINWGPAIEAGVRACENAVIDLEAMGYKFKNGVWYDPSKETNVSRETIQPPHPIDEQFAEQYLARVEKLLRAKVENQ